LILEVTETAAITNLTDAAKFMEQARDLGLRTALDDFGAGASSFGYLKKLPLDYLKIDGQFICDVLTDPLDAAAVRCFVDVAKVVGLKTIAEFVENEAVLQHLAVLGVDFAQGFHIHRPGPLPTTWPQTCGSRQADPALAGELCGPSVHVAAIAA
jgi:EAL domain-containing protein (putative c-di-GMP-specific phosphodiesterase class I)